MKLRGDKVEFWVEADVREAAGTGRHIARPVAASTREDCTGFIRSPIESFNVIHW